MKKYYIFNGTEQEGPFDIEELRSKSIKKTTPIWFKGIKEWTNASDINELSSLFILTTPPPLNNTSNIPPIFDNDTKFAQQPVVDSISKKNKNSNYYRFGALIIVVLGVILLFIFNLKGKNNSNNEVAKPSNSIAETAPNPVVDSAQIKSNITADIGSNPVNEVKETSNELKSLNLLKKKIRNNWSDYINVTRSEYYYKEIGGISGLSLIVTNTSDFKIDDVIVNVTIYKANGKPYKEQEVDIQNINAKTKKTVKLPNFDRGVTVQYMVMSIGSKQLEFCYAPGSWAKGEDPYNCK